MTAIDGSDEPVSPMQRCVAQGDLDGLRALVTIDELAIAWLRYHADTLRNEEDFWAVDALWFLPWTPDERRRVLIALVDRADTDLALSTVGAGPLEDWLLDEDEGDLRWLETTCTTHPGMRAAIGAAHYRWDVSAATTDRLDAMARG